MQPMIHEGRHLIGLAEKFLKRVLQTNEELTGLANNLPIEEARNGHKKGVDWLAKLLGIYNEEEGWHWHSNIKKKLP